MKDIKDMAPVTVAGSAPKGGKSVPNGGTEGLPGVKKNKSSNAYANGGMVARGGGAATKGLNFKIS